MLELNVNEHIKLKQLQPEHAPILFQLIHASRKSLRKFLPWVDYNTTEEHSLRFIELMQRKAESEEAIAFGIWHHDVLCGVIDLHDWDHALQKAEIGYWLAPGQQGKGLAVMSCKTLISYSFVALRCNKIEIHFVIENDKSAQVPIRLGFVKEGVLRQRAKLHGQYVDMVVMGMLRKDWKY